jgi:acetyl-CoA acetyltransferase family protein
MNDERDVVVVAGVRTPFCRIHGDLAGMAAAELGRFVVRELVELTGIELDEPDEVIIGSSSPARAGGNIARVISLAAKLDPGIPAFTLDRDDASGLESVIEAAYRIRCGHADLVVAGAVESMSRRQSPRDRDAEDLWTAYRGSKGLLSRTFRLGRMRPRHFRSTHVDRPGVDARETTVRRGQGAETLAREFTITRRQQDDFALRSHQLASAAWSEGRMKAVVRAVPVSPRYERFAEMDDCIREEMTAETLADSPAILDPRYGTVTSHNSAQPGDGAVALLLASAQRARELGLQVMGRIRSWAVSGCDPARVGLGPLYATPRALRRAGNLSLDQMDLVEINESQAVHVLACLEAFRSRRFNEAYLGRGPQGELDPERVNVNGGAIAMGDPVGVSAGRMMISVLQELLRRDQSLGLVTLSVGGGQGASVVLERS